GEKEVIAFLDKAPFVNPRIVEDLLSEIQDAGDQVLSVCVTDSQDSNRYFVGDTGPDKEKRRKGPYVSYETKDEKNGGRPTSSFGYRRIGRTASGVDVLETTQWTGGSGIFTSLLLVTLQYEDTGMSPRIGGTGDQTLTFKRRRLVIKKLG